MIQSKREHIRRRQSLKRWRSAELSCYSAAGIAEDRVQFLNYDESDRILEKSRNVFLNLAGEHEIVSEKHFSMYESKAFDSYDSLLPDTEGFYAYTDYVENTGVHYVLGHASRYSVASMAKCLFQNTYFMLDKDFGFYIRIDYCDESHSEMPNSFEVMLVRAASKDVG